MNAFNKNVLLIVMITFLGLSACEKTVAPDEGTAAPAPTQTDKQHQEDESPNEDKHETDDHAHDDDEPDDDEPDDDEHDDEHAANAPASLDDLPEGVNVVQHEMLLLNDAMIGVYSMIIANQLEGIPAKIYSVHDARNLTEGALKEGKYQPPKNGDDVEAFMKLDEVFHDDLVELVKAAKQDDLKLATEKYADVIQGCTDCHTQYRY